MSYKHHTIGFKDTNPNIKTQILANFIAKFTYTYKEEELPLET